MEDDGVRDVEEVRGVSEARSLLWFGGSAGKMEDCRGAVCAGLPSVACKLGSMTFAAVVARPVSEVLISVPSSGSRKDLDSCSLPPGKVYPPNPNGSSGNALRRWSHAIFGSLMEALYCSSSSVKEGLGDAPNGSRLGKGWVEVNC